MRIICLKQNPLTYSSNSYLILGDWNRLDDINTLIDVGSDAFVLEEIAGISTGVGKRPIEQIVITHGHFDHNGGIQAVKKKYSCLTMGYSLQQNLDKTVQEGDFIRCGDKSFEIIHTPGHSGDSICLFCEEEKVLFSGDMSLTIQTIGGCYTEEFVNSLRKLLKRSISIIYPGHGFPICNQVTEMLSNTLHNVTESKIIT